MSLTDKSIMAWNPIANHFLNKSSRNWGRRGTTWDRKPKGHQNLYYQPSKGVGGNCVFPLWPEPCDFCRNHWWEIICRTASLNTYIGTPFPCGSPLTTFSIGQRLRLVRQQKQKMLAVSICIACHRLQAKTFGWTICVLYTTSTQCYPVWITL